MHKDANYTLTFSQQGTTTGALDALGNPAYNSPVETTILCWLHGVRQNAIPPVLQGAGIEVDNHTPMIGFVLNPNSVQSDGSVVPLTNVIPTFAISGIDCKATHLGTSRTGRFKFYRREIDMAAHARVAQITGVQITGFLMLQG